jgi:DNA repair exonuclease SbcCD ATPase subunit
VIIRTLRVQGFGCFADEVEVGPFGNGVNLLYAPNGTGKTTLMRALTMALVDGYRVKSADMQAWRPWGRALAPRVVIEFEFGGKEYRLEKRFLDGASCALFRKEGASWCAYMENDDADEFLRKDILNCTPPGSGTAKPKHWGLAQVLWTTQGDLAMPELSENVVETIQKSVGATLTRAGSKIETGIENLYSEFFTGSRGTLKSGRNGAPLHNMQREYDDLLAAKREAMEALASFEAMAAHIEDLNARLAEAGSQGSKIQVERAQLTAEVDVCKALSAERCQQVERKRTAEAVYGGLKSRIETIDRARVQIEYLNHTLARMKDALPALEAAAEHRTEAVKAAESALITARIVEQAAIQEQAVARTAREYNDTRRQADEASARIREIVLVHTRIGELDAELGQLLAPSTSEISGVHQAIASERQALHRLEMASIAVEIEPARDTRIQVIEGDSPGIVNLNAGTAVILHGSPNVAFELPELGRIRVNGPVSDYTAIREELDSARAVLRSFDDSFGTHNPDQLEAMRAARATVEHAKAEQLARRQGLLGIEPEEQLPIRRDSLVARVAQIEREHLEWGVSAPDPDALPSSTSAGAEAASDQRSHLEKAWSDAQSELLATEKERAAAVADIESTTQCLKAFESEFEILVGDGLADEQRKAALDAAALDYDAARAKLDEVESKLRAYPTDPAARMELIDRQLTQLGRQAHDIEEALVRAETRIVDLGASSPHDRLATVDETLAITAAKLERESRRMDAIKLVYTVVTGAKAELLESVSVPVEKTATDFLSQICGTTIAGIRMSPRFEPEEVVPAALSASDDGVKLDRLSGGEKEQVYLCTRLAVAKEIARTERQFCVLDDVLAFTDSARLMRVCELLSRAASEVQIIILTCHPERFLAIRDARLIDLEALLAPVAVGERR